MDVDGRWLMEAQARQGRDGNVKAQARWMQVQQMQERLRQTTRRTACPAQSSPALLGFGMPRAKAVSRSYRGGGLAGKRKPRWTEHPCNQAGEGACAK